MTGAQAFRNGFLLGTAFCLGTCVSGCTAEDRVGHRMDFTVLRSDMDSASASSSASAAGPGNSGKGSNAASDVSSDGSGWTYGIGYSIPVGESQEEAPLRLMVAHLSGMRGELQADSAATRASIDHLADEMRAYTDALELAEARREVEARREPPAAVTEPVVPPPTPTSETETPPPDDPPGWLASLGSLSIWSQLGLGTGGAGALIGGAWWLRRPLLSLLSKCWPWSKS